jgi:hypothetical protein
VNINNNIAGLRRRLMAWIGAQAGWVQDSGGREE